PLLLLPKNIVPSLTVPSPHPWQNSVPTGVTVGVNHARGRIGFGPSWFVFCGAWPEHVSCGPQPKFPPSTIRLISSLQLGPASVSHRFPVCGSNEKPNEFRWP